MSRSLVAVALLAVVSLSAGGCASGDDASPGRPTTPTSVPTTTEPPVPAATTTQPAATSPATTPGATTTVVAAPTTLPPTAAPTGVSFIVVDDAGVTRDGQLVVPGPVVWADDDEMGGVVYLPAGDHATIRWLPAGADQPIDTGLRSGMVGMTSTQPALVTSGDAPTAGQCGGIVSDGEVHAINARPLDASTGIGSPELVTCAQEGADDWYATVSYRNGHLLRVNSYAAAWKYTDDEIALTGPDGERIELPATTFGHWISWSEQQRELDAELSPDATLIAVRQRLDNRWSNGPDPETGEIDEEEWERLTAVIPSTIRVVALATGTIRYETQVPYGVELGDFDGRHLVLIDGGRSTIVDTLGDSPPATVDGTVVFARPAADWTGTILPTPTPVTVRRGDAGAWVSHLQLRLLVHDPAAGPTVDGRFGPATDAAVREFQRRHGLEPDGIAGPSTWAALLNAPGELPILLVDGIADIDVGTPADEAVAALVRLLGAPSRDVTVDLEGECVEGSDWIACTSVYVIADGRILTWERLGLDVLLTDRDPAAPTVATALHLGGWRLRAGTSTTTGPVLATTDGLHIGSPFSDVRRAHPDLELYLNEGVYDTFTMYPDGRLVGELGLTWSEQVRMVQQALAARGADIAVDGELDPATFAAWDAFVTAQGLTGETGFPSITVLTALGITFDDVPVTELWSA